tara:strand:- start:1740 stop:2900 length:1161 start_codon:yes stop_codon:yes gene_type:complete
MDSFNYTITITKEKFPQLFEMKKKNRTRMIGNMLELGYSCYFRDPSDFDENQVPEHLVGIAQNKEVMDVLNRLTGICNNSSKKGTFAENIIANYINEHYLDCVYEDKSNVPHSGDGWLITPNNTIMIESKNYQTNISINELNKMERDMLENKITYGIFLSLQSDLIGFKPIDFHTFKNKNGDEYFIFIVGRLVNNISLIDIAIKFINSLNQKTLINFDIVESFNNIKDDINDLNKIIKLNDNYVEKVSETKNSINKMLSTLEKEIREYSHKSKIIIDSIIKTLNKNITGTVNSNVSSIFKKYKNHNMYILLKKIIENIKINNIIYCLDKYGIINMKQHNDEIGNIKVNKTRISLTFNKYDGINFVFKDIENNDNFYIMKKVSTQFN